MYTQYFGLTGYPFDNILHTDELFATQALAQAKRRIEHLLELCGVGLITGEAGCGKTTACRQLAESLHPAKYKVGYLALTTGSTIDTLQLICHALGLAPVNRRARAWQMIRNEIQRLSDEKKVAPVLIIDEAHHLSRETLEDLRLLTNFNFDTTNRLCLLLVGLTELRHRFRMSALESLAQRLVMNHHFGTLSHQETAQYLDHRMRCAGAPELSYFSDNASHAVHQASQGVIRQIDRIAHYTLMAAANDQAKQATAQHVETACEEIRL